MLFKRSPAADCRDLLIIFMSNKNNPNPPNKVIPIENPFTQNLMIIKNSSKKCYNVTAECWMCSDLSARFL